MPQIQELELEKEIEKYLSQWLSKYDKDECWKDYAFDILNIVKKHPEVVAEICHCYVSEKNCPNFHGTGIVARKD